MALIFDKVKKHVTKIFQENGKKDGVKHLERTVYWLKQLKPNVDEAMLIAAFAHDIERPLRTKAAIENVKESSGGYMNEDHLKQHQERGAEIIGEFLESIRAESMLIERVKMLISKHEVGGNDDQNLLKDADSISFFETNAPRFLTKHLPLVGKEKVKEKFDFMFERITSEKAKEIARPMYKRVMGDLKKID